MAFGFDSSIILNQPRPEEATPNQTLALLSQLRTQRLQQQEAQYKQGRERGLADLVSQNAGVYSDPAARAFAQGGYGAEAQDAQAQAVARQQQQAALLKIHSDLTRSRLSAAKTPEQYNQVLSSLSPDVRAMYNLPDKYDAGTSPDIIKGFITAGITPEKQAEQEIERDKLNKSRFHLVPNPVTGAMQKIDENTGATTPVSGGIVSTDGETPAPAGSKSAEFKEKVLSKLGEDLDPTKGRANLPAKAQGQIAAAERFDQLLQAPGPFTAQRMHEATMMAATIANGGNQPTEAMVESMYPKTLRGKSAEFWQSLRNVPMDADVKPFVDQLRNQSERETTLAKKQIQQYLLNRLGKHPQAFQMFPNEAHAMAENAGLKGLYDTKSLQPIKGAHPMDAKAVQWARDNLDDPKTADLARQILKANEAE